MKNGTAKTKAGIFALSMLAMATLVMAPVLGLIAQAFPDENISKIQLVLSIAQLTGLVAAFVVGKLATAIPKRNIALLGSLLTCIFGLIPYFVSNLTVMIICSGLVGVTVGFITNTIPGLIADNFAVEERQGIMGSYVAFVSIGTMLLMYLSGKLGTINWNTSYLTYTFAGVVFLIALVCLPKDKSKSEVQHGNYDVSVKQALNGQIFAIALCGFCFMVINNAYNNNLSLLVLESGLGNSDTSGMISTVGQFGGLIAGLLMGRIASVIKNHMLASAFVTEGLGLILLAVSPNAGLLFVGSFLAGAGQSIFFAQAPFLITISVTPILITMGMAVLSAANGMGGFLSPYIINGINRAVLDATPMGAMIVGGVLGLVVSAIAFVTKFQAKCMEKIGTEGRKH